MKKRKIFAGFMEFLAAFLAVLTLGLCSSRTGRPPALLCEPPEAGARVAGFLDALCAADWATAGAFVYGTPDLSQLGQGEGPLWEAFWASLSYALPEHCSAAAQGLQMEVCLHRLDLDAVAARLNRRSTALLKRRVARAEHMEEIYDDSQHYREDFVKDVLDDALADVLRGTLPLEEVTVPLGLVYENGTWWVLPGPELADALSGG